MTAHTCSVKEQTRCTGVDCGDNPTHRNDGVCAKNGCDWNPFRLGNKTFFGKGAGFAVDTPKPFTVVTQFLTDNQTDAGKLSGIKRLYKQDGKVIPDPMLKPFGGSVACANGPRDMAKQAPAATGGSRGGASFV